MNIIAEMFSHPFIIKALIVGIMISICCSLLGVTLVLKRYSMIGDGLSHVGFGALAISSALNLPPLMVTLPVVIIFAFLLLGLNNRKQIKGDSAIALVSTGSLALGIIVISLSQNGNSQLSSYLFGSIVAISNFDLYLSIALCFVVAMIFIFFYNRIFAITFDEAFSNATGINVALYNGIIGILTAVTVVLGMKIIGSLLISALIIFPALSSMRIFKTFFGVTVSSVIISLFCFFTGFLLSYIFDFPTGATIVACNLILFVILTITEKIKNNR